MYIGLKHFAIIGVTLGLIVGIGACAEEDLSSQTGVESHPLAVQGEDADAAPGCSRRPCGHGAGFIDENGDGVCDRAGMEGCQCRGRHGKQFIDEDGDGACDHAKTKGCGCRGSHHTGLEDDVR